MGTCIVSAVDTVSPFYCNMRRLKCAYKAKVAYVNLVMCCDAWFT